MQKMSIIPHIVFEILKFKISCNLICGEYFGLELEKQIFPWDTVFTKSYSQLIHWVDPEKMHHRPKNRQTDDSLSMFFGNSRIKPGNNQNKKKKYNQHSSVLKEFQLGKITLM